MITRQTTKPRAQKKTRAKAAETPRPAPDPTTPAPFDASLAEPDLFRVSVDGLEPDAQEALRTQLIEFITRSLARMKAPNIQTVAQFVDLVKNNHGTSTPVESFLTTLMWRHYYAGGLTPDAVVEIVESEDENEGFRICFEDVMKETRRFQAAYPRLAGPASVETPGDAEDDGK